MSDWWLLRASVSTVFMLLSCKVEPAPDAMSSSGSVSGNSGQTPTRHDAGANLAAPGGGAGTVHGDTPEVADAASSRHLDSGANEDAGAEDASVEDASADASADDAGTDGLGPDGTGECNLDGGCKASCTADAGVTCTIAPSNFACELEQYADASADVSCGGTTTLGMACCGGCGCVAVEVYYDGRRCWQGMPDCAISQFTNEFFDPHPP
jgi:hypothetical protein